MKMLNQSLDRLLRSAARHRELEMESMPFALEARLLARWRRGDEPSEAAIGPAILGLFRRGLAVAFAVMLASLIVSGLQVERNPSDLWSNPIPMANLSYLR